MNLLGRIYWHIGKILFEPKHSKKEIDYNTWQGPFNSWDSVKAASTGYELPHILENCIQATQQVIAGKAAYERDSVPFKEQKFDWPLIASIYACVESLFSHCTVLDIGGSLGSSYHQNRKFFKNISHFNWIIFEQKNFVQYGDKFLTNAELNFNSDLKGVLQSTNIDIVIISGSLQYFQDPYQILEEIKNSNCRFIFFNNVPFNTGDEDILTLQTVPSTIYTASYPCWILSTTKFVKSLSTKFDFINIFQNDFSISLNKTSYKYSGGLLKRKFDHDGHN